MSKGPKLGEQKKFNLPHIFISLFFHIFAAIFIGLGYDAVVGLAGVKLEKWWKFIFPVFFALVGVRAVLMVIAVAMGFGA